MKTYFLKLPFILSLCFFIVSIATYFFLYTVINKKNEAATAILSAWQIEEYRRGNMDNLEKFLKDRVEARKEIDSHFVKSTDVVSFLNLVEELAPQTGAVAEVTLIDIPKDGSGLVVEVRAKGEFEAMYKFLALLENSPYELEITSMNLKSNKGVEGEGNIWDGTYKIKLLSFI